MGKLEDGRMAVTAVTLNPKVAWAGPKLPSRDDIAELHHKAHDACFIANSFRGEVFVAH
jgi:organic hydroperoxide reductase OsmC/OhrA